MKTTTIIACTDCYTYATGDTSSFDYYYDEEEAENIINHIEEYTTELCDEYGYMTIGDSLGFSPSACRCCGSSLAGDRHELIFIDNNQTKEHPTQ